MIKLLRRLAAATLALLAPHALAAPAPPAASVPVAPPPAITAIARPALWKVSDRDTTVYLFGTVHALPPGIEWFDGPIASAFDASQELVTEIIPPEPAQMQALVISKAVLPQSQSLRALLAPADKAHYESALAGLGLPADSFDHFEPWYAAVGLSTLPLLKDGFASANGVEEALDARAKSRGQAHSALETAEYQLSLFDGLPMATQVRYLDQVVDQLPDIRQQLGAMVDAWKVGDADLLARLINDENDDPVLLKVLLTDRNRAWADWIVRRMKRPGTVFVAVGAGHLAGPGSVQQQLGIRGIMARRVQ